MNKWKWIFWSFKSLYLMNEVEFLLEFIYVKIVSCFFKKCYAFDEKFSLKVSFEWKGVRHNKAYEFCHLRTIFLKTAFTA